MDLRQLGFVATAAHLRLGHRVQHLLLDSVPFVAIGAGNAMGFVLASRPVWSGHNIAFVTGETRCIPCCHRRQIFRFCTKHDLRGSVARIGLVRSTLAVTSLATRCALITFHAMLGLVNGEGRLCPALVVARGAFLVAFQRMVDFRQRGSQAEERHEACANQEQPSESAHLEPSISSRCGLGRDLDH